MACNLLYGIKEYLLPRSLVQVSCFDWRIHILVAEVLKYVFRVVLLPCLELYLHYL